MRALAVSFAATAVGSLTGCGQSPLIEPPPLGYQAKMADADAKDHRSAQVKRDENLAANAAPVGYACGDTVLNDQLTSGGHPVTNWVPCWDYRDEVEHRSVEVAVRDKDEAASERQAAQGLAETEIASCSRISTSERDHSPFAHKRSIDRVEPYREDNQLRGVRVIFKPVARLTADWMREDIACHRAHVAMVGVVPPAFASDPTLVGGAQINVIQNGDHLEVTIRTDDGEQAAIALARATGQPATPTASLTTFTP